MILINEWLPNPIGNDASNEFVELYNTGSSAVTLNGWSLETSAKKSKKISGSIPANGYVVLYRKETKLVLKNSDEAIALYDSSGKLVDQSSFVGSAPEGKSFSRIGSAEPLPASPCRARQSVCAAAGKGEGAHVQNFAWGEPTPGAANRVTANTPVAAINYSFNTPINQSSLGASVVVAILLMAAVCVTALVVYSIKTNEDLSQLFFGGDETAG
jgi:hypothetical protein